MKKLLKAALIVTIFSIITRALGFAIKILLSRTLSPENLGEYQIVMSIFGLLLTMTCSGLPLIASRKVAYYSSCDKNAASSYTFSALSVAFTLSIIFSVGLYFFRNIIENIYSSSNIAKMVILLIPGLIFSSIYSILRSALWGRKRFFSISFSEFFEQLIRIVCLVVLFNMNIPFLSLSEKAILSLSIACVFSSMLVIFDYFRYGGRFVANKKVFLPVIKESFPITIARSASSLVQMLIAFIIPLRLMVFGFTKTQAMAEFGIVTGMALPLITIPSTFISSIAVAIVPEMSSQTTNIDKQAPKNINVLKTNIYTAMRSTLVICFLFVPVFLALGLPIAQIIFKNSRAGTYITYGAILVAFMGINQITSSVLNAIGLEIKALKNYICGALGLIFCIYFLPKYLGAMSLVVGMLILSLVAGGMSLHMLKARKLLDARFYSLSLKLIGISLFTSAITYLLFNLAKKITSLLVATLICGITACSCYILLCICFSLVNIKMFFSSKKTTKTN